MEKERAREAEEGEEEASRVRRLRPLVRPALWAASNAYERLRMANEHRNFLLQKEFGLNPTPPSFLRPPSPSPSPERRRGPQPGGRAQGSSRGAKAKTKAQVAAPTDGFAVPAPPKRRPRRATATATATAPPATQPVRLQKVKQEPPEPPQGFFGKEMLPPLAPFHGFNPAPLLRCRELVQALQAAVRRAREKEIRLQRRRLAEAASRPRPPSNDVRVVFPPDDEIYEVRVKQEPPSSQDEEEEAEDTNAKGHYSLRKRAPVDYRELPVPDEDEILFCDECNREWEGDCPEHGPLLLLADAPVPPSAAHSEERAVLTAPPELSVATSGIPQGGRGVWARVTLPRALRMGPYQGVRSRRENDDGYSWEIRKGGRGDHYVDAGDTRVANWMRFVNCARHEQEQNVEAFQFRGAIFYRSMRALAAHEELLVWYGDAFALQLGISPKDFRAPLLRPLPRVAFACPHCSLSFTSPLYLEAHTRRCRWRFTTRNVGVGVNRSANLPSASIFANGGPYRSEECDTAFKNLGDHTPLKRSRSGQLSYRCEGSGAVSANSDTLSKHKRTHSGERPYRCEECGASFTMSGNLTRHKRTHSGKRPFRCEECGAAFTQLAHLTTHKRTHSGERPFRCEECGAAFTHTSNLTRHKQTHSGEQPYRCEECGAAFTQLGNLTTHKRTHSGERPYRCEECGASFTMSGHLTTHKRIHSGERPFRCEQCGAAFTKSGHLTRHKRIHSGERPFRCEECGASFTMSGHLTTHKRIHSGERPFRCEECGAAFTESSHLTRHKQTHSRKRRCN